MFTYESDCKRSAFRFTPPETTPITFRFKAQTVDLIEISAGGVSFKGTKLTIGERDKVRFRLPGQPTAISAELEILRIDPAGICNCRFTEIREEDAEAIHQYVLAMQKKHLAGKKGNS